MTVLYLDHAPLYEAAFGWDRTAEIAFLRELVPHREPVLEPMCGPAYLLEAFARAGHRTLGIESSKRMLEIAKRRFADARLDGEWLEADVCDFEVADAFGGAFCPVNSIALLPSIGAMGRHLRAMGEARHPGAAYLVQLDMATPAGVRKRIGAATEHGRWDFEYGGERGASEGVCEAV